MNTRACRAHADHDPRRAGERHGSAQRRRPFVLNTGDVGLRRSLGKLSAQAASRSTNSGATIAAIRSICATACR
jgi:hypothetical protein